MFVNINRSCHGKLSENIPPEIRQAFDYVPRPGDLYFNINVSSDESMLRVLVDETNASNIAISIYDINGILQSSKSGNLSQGFNVFEIDISKLISGIYVYSIELDGIKVKTGKINLIK